MPTETFKPVDKFPCYEVSNLGRVMSYRVSKLGRIRRRSVGSDGYCRVVLTGCGPHSTQYLHRLVALAHVPNPHNLPDVNHIDHNKANNAAVNLEWVTHAENLEKARAHLGNWVRSGAASPVCKPVIAYPLAGGEPIRYHSGAAAALALGDRGRAGNIAAAIRTHRPAYGFRWTFATSPATS